MRLNLRVALVLLIALVAIGGLWSGFTTAPSENDLGKPAREQKIVTLVIDFGEKSGLPVRVLKVDNLSTEATGWDVLLQSGTKVQGTSQYPSGFVCRIDGWPSESVQACDDTPSFSEGHWAYFVTSKSLGGEWIMSGQGAATHVPECGAFEGWKWLGPGEDSTPPTESPKLGVC